MQRYQNLSENLNKFIFKTYDLFFEMQQVDFIRTKFGFKIKKTISDLKEIQTYVKDHERSLKVFMKKHHYFNRSNCFQDTLSLGKFN